MENEKKKSQKRVIITVLLGLFFICLIGVTVIIALLPEKKDSAVDISMDGTTASQSSDEDTMDDEEYDVNPLKPEEAYANAKIVSKTSAKSSADVMSEKEAVQVFKERGFGEVEVTTNYDMDGIYHEDKIVSRNSSSKHPCYLASYVAETGDCWELYLINGQMIANPLNYNYDNTNALVLISEAESVMSYDNVTNSFYEIIPDGTETVVREIEHISADTLNELTSKGVDSL